jgi:hypothetical protein
VEAGPAGPYPRTPPVRLGAAPGEVLGALEHTSGGSQASHHAAMRAGFAARIGPFMTKDVAICLAERGVDPGLPIDVVRLALI